MQVVIFWFLVLDCTPFLNSSLTVELEAHEEQLLESIEKQSINSGFTQVMSHYLLLFNVSNVFKVPKKLFLCFFYFSHIRFIYIDFCPPFACLLFIVYNTLDKLTNKTMTHAALIISNCCCVTCVSVSVHLCMSNIFKTCSCQGSSLWILYKSQTWNQTNSLLYLKAIGHIWQVTIKI